MRPVVARAAVALLLLAPFAPSSSAAVPSATLRRTLDGSANNVAHPDWGRAGTPYLRVAPARYADGRSAMVGGPAPRYVSNRIFNDLSQNLFSENGISQMGWTWGQFLDHTFGLRDETPAERAPIPFSAGDPLEQFRNDLGVIDFSRTPAAPGTGTASPRQQINTVSAYIDAWNVYGGTSARLEWLRRGPVDGDLANNSAALLLPNGFLPREDARGNASSAPPMDLMGRLVGVPAQAVEAGDVRANENLALTALHTLFAREHNRIVAALPRSLSEQDKFEIARRVVGAEEQYITYHEFLPAFGVHLARYRGYDPNVDAGISNEFATVGYRAHSMIHGEIEPLAPAGAYSQAELAAFRSQGIQVEPDGEQVKLVIPLNLAFGNPALLRRAGVGPVLEGLAAEREYRNDEQIDNQLRSVLFQVPGPGVADPSKCLDGTALAGCFSGVVDLAALDIQRGRDHGIPDYNDLRRAYGLRPVRSFTEITGERSERFPQGIAIDDPRSLDFVQLRDANGDVIPLGSDQAEEDAVIGVRRTTLAARLRAIYGSVNRVDAFVGMVSERHVRGTEFGELQLAMWRKQFEALRDGDRFFYLNDPVLTSIEQRYGITYRKTLAQIIELNTRAHVQADVFKAASGD